MEPKRYCILCVDDDPGTLSARKSLLEAAGYSVLTASAGEEALDLLSDGAAPDLALLDFSMGPMNGDELAGRLRQNCPSLPLIAVSALEKLPDSFATIVDTHVRKGQSPEILLSAIADALRGRTGSGWKDEAAGIILCVDDEELQLQFRTILFESAGFIVLPARSASSALDLFRCNHVDAVVMDYWLSGANGTAVAEEMKRIRPQVPIVMLSGYSSLPGEGAVVDAWLRKAQVEPEEVVGAVKKLIGFRAGRHVSNS